MANPARLLRVSGLTAFLVVGAAMPSGADPSEPVGLFIQFEPHFATQVATDLAGLGVSILHSFASRPAAFLQAPRESWGEISAIPGVTYLEGDRQVELHLDTSTIAIRSPQVTDFATGLGITGAGIGVAVVDTGIDGTHPDLEHWIFDPFSETPTVAQNRKFVSIVSADVPNTDTTSGHGTHVAGIVAGRGNLDASFRGVAPGAALYGLGVGELGTLLWITQALDWILQNHDQVWPPIRVVQNSWGTGTSYDPDALISQLVNQLVAEGVLVVFSAGNNAGDGSTAQTSSECQNPTVGVICVAGYNDQQTGTRDGTIYNSSSRGQISQPDTWPDISAPGVGIMSTNLMARAFVDGSAYRSLTGTSMAAPHVAGVAALMFSVDPWMNPSAVQMTIQQTAYKFTDGGLYEWNPQPHLSNKHFAKGAGLVDAYSAVQAVLS